MYHLEEITNEKVFVGVLKLYVRFVFDAEKITKKDCKYSLLWLRCIYAFAGAYRMMHWILTYGALLNNKSIVMSFSAPMLTRDQIEEVRNLVHGILEDNKRIIDDVLSELVDIESTNILGKLGLI